ncbi:MAG: hypothetical protein JWR26_928 [Pedosphaera sp.]|nr:hypothetical protein [Pedosphaera sp.]
MMVSLYKGWVPNVLFLGLLCWVLFLTGCIAKEANGTKEVVPSMTSVAQRSDLEPYRLEFSQPQTKAETILPFDRHIITGSIDIIDHNTNCSSWLILSHTGTNNFYDGQKLTLYSEKSHSFSEVATFAGARVGFATILSNIPDGSPLIVAIRLYS